MFVELNLIIKQYKNLSETYVFVELIVRSKIDNSAVLSCDIKAVIPAMSTSLR